MEAVNEQWIARAIMIQFTMFETGEKGKSISDFKTMRLIWWLL